MRTQKYTIMHLHTPSHSWNLDSPLCRRQSPRGFHSIWSAKVTCCRSNWSGVVNKLQFSRCYIFVVSEITSAVHYDDTPFWISAGTNKDDLEW